MSSDINFSIADVSLRIGTEDLSIAGFLEDFLPYCRSSAVGRASDIPSVSLVLSYVDSLPAPGDVLPGSELESRTPDDQEFWVLGSDWVLVRPGLFLFERREGGFKGYLWRGISDLPVDVLHQGLKLLIIKVLWERHIFIIHAGIAVGADRRFFICGTSGSGKSTVSFALAQQNYHIVSEDITFFRHDDRGFRLFPLSDGILMLPRSLELFPAECAHRWEGELTVRGSRKKIRYRMSVPGGSDPTVFDSFPEACLFPEIRGIGTHQIIPVSGEEGLVRLMAQSLLYGDRRIMIDHFQTLARGVQGMRFFRLIVGENPIEIGTLLEGIRV